MLLSLSLKMHHGKTPTSAILDFRKRGCEFAIPFFISMLLKKGWGNAPRKDMFKVGIFSSRFIIFAYQQIGISMFLLPSMYRSRATEEVG